MRSLCLLPDNFDGLSFKALDQFNGFLGFVMIGAGGQQQ